MTPENRFGPDDRVINNAPNLAVDLRLLDAPVLKGLFKIAVRNLVRTKKKLRRSPQMPAKTNQIEDVILLF